MVQYDFLVLRDGAYFKKLRVHADTTPTVSFTAAAEIKRTCTLDIEPDPDVDWLTDRLEISRVDGDKRLPLGLFWITTSEIVTDADGGTRQSLTGYDMAYTLRELAVLERTMTIPAGTLYTDAIREQLLAAGVTLSLIVANAATMAVAHTYEMGANRLDIVNGLLRELNYRELWFDGSGVARCEPWAPTAITAATHYYGGKAIPTGIAQQESQDLFSAGNVFIELVSSPDLDADLRAESVNDDISSPLSVQRRGIRIPDIETLDSIASMAALEGRANARRLASMMGSTLYTFTSGADYEDAHGLRDSMVLHRGNAGHLEEQSWSWECVPGGTVAHTGRTVRYTID